MCVRMRLRVRETIFATSVRAESDDGGVGVRADEGARGGVWEGFLGWLRCRCRLAR